MKVHACQFSSPWPRAPLFEAALGSVSLLPPSGERSLDSARDLSFLLPQLCCCIRRTFSKFSSTVLCGLTIGDLVMPSNCKANPCEPLQQRDKWLQRSLCSCFRLACGGLLLMSQTFTYKKFCYRKNNPKIFLKHKKMSWSSEGVNKRRR